MDSPTFDSQEADRLSSIRSPHRMACSCNWESPGSMVASWQKCRSPFASSPKRLLRWCTKIMEGPQNTTNKQNITHKSLWRMSRKKTLGFPSGWSNLCELTCSKNGALQLPKNVTWSWRISMTSMGNSNAHLWRNWCEHPQKIPGTSWKSQGAQPCKWLPFSIGCWFPKSSYRKWLEISIHPSTCRPYKIAAGDTCDKWLENQRTRKHN